MLTSCYSLGSHTEPSCCLLKQIFSSLNYSVYILCAIYFEVLKKKESAH